MSFSLSYYVLVDEVLEAEAHRDSNGWRVHPHSKSRLKEENFEAIHRALESAENPNL